MRAKCSKGAIKGLRAVNDQIGSGKNRWGTAGGRRMSGNADMMLVIRLQDGNDMQVCDQPRGVRGDGR